MIIIKDLQNVSLDEIKKLFKACGIIHEIEDVQRDGKNVFIKVKNDPSWNGLISLEYNSFQELGNGVIFVKWCLYYGYDSQIEWDNIC